MSSKPYSNYILRTKKLEKTFDVENLEGATLTVGRHTRTAKTNKGSVGWVTLRVQDREATTYFRIGDNDDVFDSWPTGEQIEATIKRFNERYAGANLTPPKGVK